jgi:hypothetical protein
VACCVAAANVSAFSTTWQEAEISGFAFISLSCEPGLPVYPDNAIVCYFHALYLAHEPCLAVKLGIAMTSAVCAFYLCRLGRIHVGNGPDVLETASTAHARYFIAGEQASQASAANGL